MNYYVNLDAGKKFIVGNPSNFELILEHIITSNEVPVLSIYVVGLIMLWV